MTYYLVIVRESKQKTDKMKPHGQLFTFQKCALGMSPDNEITNIGKREISTDKSVFKQYSPSYQKTLL